MSIMHHFTTEQARQFGEEFGIDWQWSRTIEERDPADLNLEMEEYGRYYPKIKVEGKGSSASAKSRPVCRSKRKNPSGKMS